MDGVALEPVLVLSQGLTRWHAASASAFLEANAGLQYVFGDVSGSLRTRLGYTQRQLDGLGTAKARARVGAAHPSRRAAPRARTRAGLTPPARARPALRAAEPRGRPGAHCTCAADPLAPCRHARRRTAARRWWT
jgi:hypothetical protein